MTADIGLASALHDKHLKFRYGNVTSKKGKEEEEWEERRGESSGGANTKSTGRGVGGASVGISS